MTHIRLASSLLIASILVACTPMQDNPAEQQTSESSSQNEAETVTATFSDGGRTMSVSIQPNGEWQYMQSLDAWLRSPLVTSDPESPFASIVSKMEWQPQTYVFYHAPGGFGYIEYWPDRAVFLEAKNRDVPGSDALPPAGQVVTDVVADINGVPFRKVHSYYNHSTTATGYIPGTSGTTHTHCAYFPENMNGVLYVGAIDALDHDTCQTLIDLKASVTVK